MSRYNPVFELADQQLSEEELLELYLRSKSKKKPKKLSVEQEDIERYKEEILSLLRKQPKKPC